MWIPTVLLIITLLLFIISATQVVKNRKKKLLNQTPNETIPSVISQALTYLVGVAGGIYISLVMLTSFLKIDFPESVQVLGLSLDPLAIIAMVLAIIQPWLIKLHDSIIDKKN